MELNPNTGEEITLAEAVNLTSAFRKNFPGEVKAFYIGSNNVQAILDQPNCIGVRIYNGYNEKEGALSAVLIGVDKDEKDMTSGIIMDRLLKCPPKCDPHSPLI